MFKVNALKTRKAVEAMMNIPFDQVKEDMVRTFKNLCGVKIHKNSFIQKSGKAVPCYISTLLDAHRDHSGFISPEDEEDIKGSAGTLFAGKSHSSLLPLLCS